MFHNIAFSGGGTHTMTFIGCIKYMEENNHLIDIRNIIGASGGSFFALLLMLGWTSERIRVYCEKELVKHLESNRFNILSVFNLPRIFGLNNGDFLIKIIEDVLERSGVDPQINFIDITKLFGKNIVIATTNITSRKIEYLSVDTYPEMKISTAVRMSVSIPILFSPVKYYDDLYVDSMIYNNFPINFFTQFNIDTLGININIVDEKKKPTNFFSYMSLIYNCLYDSVMKKNTETIKNDMSSICNIDINESKKKFDLYNMKFVLDDAFITEMSNIGYDSLRVFFQEA